jgi:hypothetical protein
MLRMCVYMHSHFVENHPIRILKDGPLISEVVLSQMVTGRSLSTAGIELSSITVLSGKNTGHQGTPVS